MRAWRSDATAMWLLPEDTKSVAMDCVHPAGLFEAPLPAGIDRYRLQAPLAVGRGGSGHRGHGHVRRSLSGLPDGGRARFAPHRRGPPPCPVAGAGRPVRDFRGSGRDRLLGVGAERPLGARGRRLELLGRTRPPHPRAGLVGYLGAVYPRGRARVSLQVRAVDRPRMAAAQSRPDGPPGPDPTGHRQCDRRAVKPPLG